MLLAAADNHNPTPNIPLIDHYQIDYGMGGVEYDTIVYGSVPPVGINYERVLGAESIMHKLNIKTGVFLNAFEASHHSGCLVACDPSFSFSRSAALRTINYTQGYMKLPIRTSEYTILEQWMDYPNLTGLATVEDSGMWMATESAKIVQPHVKTTASNVSEIL